MNEMDSLKKRIAELEKVNRGLVSALHAAKNITEYAKLDELKSDFISTVSHELRTPLSIIKEGISLVLDEIPGNVNEKQTEILDISKSNVDNLVRVIDNLLDMYKIEARKVE